MSISIIIITGNQRRHIYVANRLIEHYNIKGVISEPIYEPQATTFEKNEIIIRTHFLERQNAENCYFSDFKNFNIEPENFLLLKKGEINTQEVFKWIKILNPQYLILFGSSFVKSPILDYYQDKIINMHLGLSPYYRGSGTNFWPLVNREPELVGTTTHLATKMLDGGPILKQVRPQINISDTCHDIGCKAIISGTDVLIDSINLYHHGELSPIYKKGSGKFYKRDDFSAGAVLKMRFNFDSGMIDEYLNDVENRLLSYPIVD